MTEPVPGELQVISFVPFHLVGLGVPTYMFVWRFLRYFGLRLHDLTPRGVAYLAVFVTLCECWLGVDPHFDLWQRIFRLPLNKNDNGFM